MKFTFIYIYSVVGNRQSKIFNQQSSEVLLAAMSHDAPDQEMSSRSSSPLRKVLTPSNSSSNLLADSKIIRDDTNHMLTTQSHLLRDKLKQTSDVLDSIVVSHSATTSSSPITADEVNIIFLIFLLVKRCTQEYGVKTHGIVTQISNLLEQVYRHNARQSI